MDDIANATLKEEQISNKDLDNISQIGIIGAGQMGSGITGLRSKRLSSDPCGCF